MAQSNPGGEFLWLSLGKMLEPEASQSSTGLAVWNLPKQPSRGVLLERLVYVVDHFANIISKAETKGRQSRQCFH